NIGLIVTNFAIPDDNYLRTDQDSLQTMIVSISDVQTRDSTFFRRNNLIKLTDNIGVKLNVNEGENWFGQAVITDVNFNHNIVQFFPPFFITEPENRNFINNIYPNPLIIDQNAPLIITYVVSDEKPGELAIYTSNGRLVTNDEFSDSRPDYRIFDWDGRNDNGDFVSSGVYIVLLRVGGSVDMKKLAVVRK
ncbi:MAG: T9SS type A sorting domain-containing protein, partial [bacterium]